MSKFFAGAWMGIISVLVLQLYLYDKPMKEVCAKIGEGFELSSYNSEVFVCSNGKDTSTIPMGSLKDGKKDRKVLH